jgi:membrane-associated phospholipid phosphatase
MQLLPVHKKINRMLWVAIAAIMAVDSLLLWQSGMHIIIPRTSDVLVTVAWIGLLCVAVNVVQPFFRQHATAMDRLWLLANFNCQMAAVGVGIAVLSYLTARFNLPMYDDTLIAIDHFFGFDWVRYVRFVDAHFALSWMVNFSYYSFQAQMIFFLILFPVTGQFTRAQHFMIIVIFCGLVTVMLAALIPAICGHVYYDIGQEFSNLDTHAGVIHKDIMYGLRDGSLTALSFPLQGIVTFPSFHAMLAVLLAYASLTFRILRWVFVPLNVAMVFATPAVGGHYLVDVVAGVGVGFLAIYIARRILPGVDTQAQRMPKRQRQ